MAVTWPPSVLLPLMDRALDDIVHDSRTHGRRHGASSPRSTVYAFNLHYGLNEQDLEELFEKVGPVTKVTIRYDRAGRSIGVAWISYSSAEDARDAVRRFNGRPAAGQTLRLQLVDRSGQFPRNDTRSRRGPALDARITPSSDRSSRGPRRARPAKTAEELDAELDSYMGGQRSEETTAAGTPSDPSSGAPSAPAETGSMQLDSSA